jgi:type IV pilus assembly protein PilM
VIRNPFKRVQSTASVVGLEFDPSHLAAAEVTVNGKVTVERAGVAMLRPGVLRDGEVSDPDELAAELRRLFAEHQLGSDVRIGLANQRIVVRTLDLPPIEDPRELEAAVRLQAPDHIPMPIDDAVLDFQSLGLVNTPHGDRTRVVVVAARRDMIRSVLAAAKAANLNVVGIDLSAFAIIRALDDEIHHDEAVLLVNVAGLTNVVVAAGPACLFTRTAALGIESMAATLAERGSLTLEHSRQWLVHVGLEVPVEELSGDPEILEAARAVLTDGVHHLADAVRNSLNFYRMQESSQPVERAVLTGPAVGIPGFAEALGRELKLPVTAALAAADPDAVPDASRLSVAAGLAVAERPG